MSLKTQPNTLGDFLKYEAAAEYSREEVTIASGQNLPGGMVIGRETATGKIKASPAAGADGTQVAIGVLLFPVDATAADKKGVIAARHAIVSRAGLSYEASVDTTPERDAKHTQLVAVGILPRDAA